jgi:hypothetical protein
LVAALATAAAAVTSGGTSTAATGPVVDYDFDSAAVTAASTGGGGGLTSTGSAAVDTSVVSANGGAVQLVGSRATQGGAVRFPGFDASDAGQRAVIKIVNTSGTDALAPGKRDFTWSADFRLDADSASHVTGSRDNGDNLFQRGLYKDTQFKLDVDNRRPSCRLRGSTGGPGAVRVIAPVSVSDSVWYHAVCSRVGNRLTVSVSAFDPAGDVTQSWTKSATSTVGFGTVSWARIGTPLTIGGKLSPAGKLVTPSSDQFNGDVDNAELTFAS